MINEHSDTWLEVVARCEAKIAELRADYDKSPNHETTTRIQGQIRAYKEVLSWPKQSDYRKHEAIEFDV